MTDLISLPRTVAESLLCLAANRACFAPMSNDALDQLSAALREALAAPVVPEGMVLVAELHPHHLRPSEHGEHWCREVLLYSGGNPGDKVGGKNIRVKLYAAAPQPKDTP